MRWKILLDKLEAKEIAWTKFQNNPEIFEKLGKETPEEFTTEDSLKKEQLLSEGFSSWNKRDFYKFISMCEIFGRENHELFSELLAGGKTLEEIKLYSEAFWVNYKKIDKYEKYIERIEKGELEIKKR